MRTTVNIPEGLLARLRVRAAESGRTLSDVVTEAVRSLLDRQGRETRSEGWKPSRLLTPRPGIDLSSNVALYDLMDEEDGWVARP